MCEQRNEAPWCTCSDQACPAHPTNHTKGCTPCIRKNLRQGEIPSCFFRDANPGRKPEAYFYRDFAEHVLSADPKRDSLTSDVSRSSVKQPQTR